MDEPKSAIGVSNHSDATAVSQEQICHTRTYSCLRAAIGSIRDALRAGAYPAKSVAPSKVTTAPESASGSLGFMPYKNEATNFDVASAAPMPAANPTPA